MTIDHLTTLHGLPVHDFPSPDEESGPVPAADTVAWRLSRNQGYGGESFEECWDRFLDTVDTARVRALVLGAGAYGSEFDADDPAETATRLVAAADRLTGLEALYLADLTFEESELSWIVQGDVTPILAAYPRLLEFGVRGSGNGFEDGPGLQLTPLRHEHLRVLRLENGGLPGEVARAVAACDLPALRRLDLWLGAEYYGCTTTLADLAPVLDGDRLPALRHLGLRNSEIQDEIAAAVAGAPVVARLASLHLGLGTLSDTGAAALLSGQPLTHLEELDLRHHFLSEPMMQRLREALEPAGVKLDLEEREQTEEDEDRYVAAGE
ncbi:STM4015 family protein [Streptomyces apricus]|uniref:Leucine-rich repeat domain-containing protein n=1 Tax=Streptomyces apricus TaxID=1828112 RepID=A0A5B0BGS2_9ACTN|nr:STM4015 family protein [Streptomyces apricus]KAA0941220.1 leucine-rich repeat domain-containing protein [Streptomyces apricus]